MFVSVKLQSWAESLITSRLSRPLALQCFVAQQSGLLADYVVQGLRMLLNGELIQPAI